MASEAARAGGPWLQLVTGRGAPLTRKKERTDSQRKEEEEEEEEKKRKEKKAWVAGSTRSVSIILQMDLDRYPLLPTSVDPFLLFLISIDLTSGQDRGTSINPTEP